MSRQLNTTLSYTRLMKYHKFTRKALLIQRNVNGYYFIIFIFLLFFLSLD